MERDDEGDRPTARKKSEPRKKKVAARFPDDGELPPDLQVSNSSLLISWDSLTEGII